MNPAAILVLFAAPLLGTFQEPPKPNPETQQIFLPLQHAKAEGLVKSLKSAFGKTLTIEMASGTPVTGLLISGPPKSVNEIKEMIPMLDRPSRRATMEVILVELVGVREFQAKTPGELEVELGKLKEKGILVHHRTMEIQLVENQQGKTQTQENKALATGVNQNRGGLAQRSFQYSPTGTIITTTMRYGPNEETLVDIKVEDSRLVSQPKTEGEFQPDGVGQWSFETTVALSKDKLARLQATMDQEAKSNRVLLAFARLK